MKKKLLRWAMILGGGTGALMLMSFGKKPVEVATLPPIQADEDTDGENFVVTQQMKENLKSDPILNTSVVNPETNQPEQDKKVGLGLELNTTEGRQTESGGATAGISYDSLRDIQNGNFSEESIKQIKETIQNISLETFGRDITEGVIGEDKYFEKTIGDRIKESDLVNIKESDIFTTPIDIEAIRNAVIDPDMVAAYKKKMEEEKKAREQALLGIVV